MRPTPDALREQAFGVLTPHLEHAHFLDLFAGTGANSLEALSRGAATATLVDEAGSAASLVRRNFAAIGVAPERWELIACPAERAVRALAERGWRCQLAWCDPPFAAWELGPAALAAAAAGGVLAPGALVVLELPPRREVAIPGLVVVRGLRGAVLLQACRS